jgi:hypothetical protein
MTIDDGSLIQQEESLSSLEKNGTSKTNVIAISVGGVIVVIAIVAVCFWYFAVKAPHDQAVENYQAAAASYSAAAAILEGKNAELEAAIASLQAVIDSEEEPLEDILLTAVVEMLEEAQGLVTVIPDIESMVMPTETTAINAAASELNTKAEELGALGNYDEMLAELSETQLGVEAYIRQRQLAANQPGQFEGVNDPGLAGFNLPCH